MGKEALMWRREVKVSSQGIHESLSMWDKDIPLPPLVDGGIEDDLLNPYFTQSLPKIGRSGFWGVRRACLFIMVV
jgi:hypothetical protein